MTRKQASKASIALQKSDDFRDKLMSFLGKELKRREEILRNL